MKLSVYLCRINKFGHVRIKLDMLYILYEKSVNKKLVSRMP